MCSLSVAIGAEAGAAAERLAQTDICDSPHVRDCDRVGRRASAATSLTR